jgi:type IV pilus assembly protein PilQ
MMHHHTKRRHWGIHLAAWFCLLYGLYTLCGSAAHAQAIQFDPASPPSGQNNAATHSSTTPYQGALISLHFQGIEVRSLLQVFADFTGINIIVSDAVKGSMTLRLKDVPWDQALAIVLETNGLAMRQQDQVIWIAPKAEILAKEKLSLEQHALRDNLSPLQAEVFQLNYQKVDEFRKSFGINDDGSVNPNRKNTILSARGSAMIDKRTNQLFVTDTAAVLAHIRTLIQKIDIPAKRSTHCRSR